MNSPSTVRPDVDERLARVEVSDTHVIFHLQDGRIVHVPLAWSWRLAEAAPDERQNFEISPSGYGVHWPDVDEDLSVRGALRGRPAPRPGEKTSLAPPDASGSDRAPWSPGAVKQLRQRLDLSQAEMAERMGVRQATVSDWETGKQTPSSMATRLLDLLAGSLAAKDAA